MNGKKYHFIGVAGVGMSAVAQAAVSAGCSVSGSERIMEAGGGQRAVIEKLMAAGIRFFIQDGSGITQDLDAVVISTAIEDDNPDLKAAREYSIPILHRSEMLAKLAEGRKLIAVTGTSGKSSVTGMLGWMLQELGADPTVVNGAPVINWITSESVGNVRTGNSDLWIIEADESDRSLLNYHPQYAVITNASADHFSLDETIELFVDFCAQVEGDIINGIGIFDLLTDLNIECKQWESTFTYKNVDFKVPVPGKHNIENAVYSVKLCEILGYELDKIAEALSSFQGIHRRLERVGIYNGIAVIDEYAHNPAKIEAALRTFAGSEGKVISIWRPHGFGPLSSMMDDLVDCFSRNVREQDKVFIMPVYDAGGTAERVFNSDVLVEKLQKRFVDAEFIEPEIIPFAVNHIVQKGDTVILMGARDPNLPELARKVLRTVKRLEEVEV